MEKKRLKKQQVLITNTEGVMEKLKMFRIQIFLYVLQMFVGHYLQEEKDVTDEAVERSLV